MALEWHWNGTRMALEWHSNVLPKTLGGFSQIFNDSGRILELGGAGTNRDNLTLAQTGTLTQIETTTPRLGDLKLDHRRSSFRLRDLKLDHFVEFQVARSET